MAAIVPRSPHRRGRRTLWESIHREPSVVSIGSTATVEAAWNEVAERLEAFVAAWESGAAPAIADHLPAGPPARRRLVLVELVKVDLEFRARGPRPPLVEDYLAAFPELADADGPPVELLCEEYHVRRAHGAAADVANLCRRFPGRAVELQRWIGAAEGTLTTSLAAGLVRAEFRPGETIDDFQLLAEVGRGATFSFTLGETPP
jgi:hypothetical protein